MYNLFYTKQIKNLILYNKKRILCERGLKLNNDQKQSQKLFKTKYFTNIELPYTVKTKCILEIFILCQFTYKIFKIISIILSGELISVDNNCRSKCNLIFLIP